ncbi:MAG: type II toxin-antitoxin system PemK/MazF family toxin [Elusimicrobiota bacterium]
MRIERSKIYLANLNPPFKTEPGKIRPVVVVQSNLINGHHPSTLICPITSKVKKDIRIMRIHIPKQDSGLHFDSDILVDQARAIDNSRLIKKVGSIPFHQMEKLNNSLKILLELD